MQLNPTTALPVPDFKLPDLLKDKTSQSEIHSHSKLCGESGVNLNPAAEIAAESEEPYAHESFD
jgi:hypothetical protein